MYTNIMYRTRCTMQNIPPICKLVVHDIGMHTAQYLFATQCKLQPVPLLTSKSKICVYILSIGVYTQREFADKI